MQLEICPAQMKGTEDFCERLITQPVFESVPREALFKLVEQGVYVHLPVNVIANKMFEQDPQELISESALTLLKELQPESPLGEFLVRFKRGIFAVLLSGEITTWLVSPTGERIQFQRSFAPYAFLDCPWDNSGYKDEYSLLTTQPTELFLVGMDGFREFAKANPSVALFMLTTYQEVVRWDFNHYLATLSKNSVERVARLLRELAMQQGDSGCEVIRKLEVQNVADAVEISPAEAQDSLKHLQEKGFISDSDTGYKIEISKLTELILSGK